MVGNNSEQAFKLDEYEEFYEHHAFEPIQEAHAYIIHEYIPRFSWAFDHIEEMGAKTLLDLGCLDGSFALTVASELGLDVTGVDLTMDGIEIANSRAKSRNLPAKFYQGTIEDFLEKYAKEGKKFDAVTCFEVIEHVKDVQLMLKLIDDVLAPGGSVFVSTPDFEGPAYGADDEQNKCHIRLYTTAKADYERANKFGNVRKATSIWQELGESRVKEVAVHNQLINCRYQ